ncbi:hypothetical protein GGQ92_001299 [Gracilibacillus halotolerans]|uniref:TIGR00299 family protein n=1 Tax=Gracilibacillus halotolerans TaxID=74386 RepID=A0A841RM30_9BACI|nr:nickel pincer cofactor biosynthesis protein LarC [Gracilibacillus halotolerans]MBB6512516.1 hypothetical protein [Gracilibacillus halotolerans]
MVRILYLDCFSGISGDMTVGALLDAGGDFNKLKSELLKLGIEEEYELAIEKVNKNGITSSKFTVKLNEEEGNHHHDDHHHHDDSHDHHHHDHSHHHHHDHRTYKHIKQMIQTSELNLNVKEMALSMFHIIAAAEAKIHGTDIEHVHFHEVGAVDSIIDIVGAAILIDALEIDEIISSPVPVGSGHVHIDHGIYPVPAPATLEILKDVPIQHTSVKGELTTPTGAAIVKALVNQFGTMPSMEVKSIGYGAGTKTFKDHPNVLRAVIGTIKGK